MRGYGWVLKVHRTSALFLLIFLTGHMVNHLWALAGVESHIAFMNVARFIYRSWLVEPLIVLSVIVQSVTGFIQLRHVWGRWPTVWHKIQIFSGLYLMLFMINHTVAIFITLRTVFELDSNFYAAAAGLLIAPLHWFFIPYYALGVIALFAHIASFIYFRMSYNKVKREKIAFGFILSGFAVSFLIVAAFGGFLYDIELPENVRKAYEKFVS